MAIIQVKKYKTIKDENGNKIQVEKTKEEWNKETNKGTATWYFVERYTLNEKVKQYKSKLFTLKRDAEEERMIFKANPIEYIKNHSKKAKNNINVIINDAKCIKNLNEYFDDFLQYEMSYNKESTVYDHQSIWKKHISPYLGELTPNKITFAVIQEWHELINLKTNEKNKKVYSVESKNTFHSTLTSFLQYLFQKGLIEMNYAKIIGSFKNTNSNKNDVKKLNFKASKSLIDLWML